MKRMLALIPLAAILMAGCGQPQADQAGDPNRDNGQAAKTGESNPVGHDHSGWWCPEHGIPEEVCSMCSAKAAEKFKSADDWCKKHDRADSQCFICHPERKEHYARLYRAKYGKEPPKIEE